MLMAKKKPNAGKNWPDTLKGIRANLGDGTKPLSQAEAARRVGVSTRAWIKWEMGYQIPTPSHQILIGLLADGKI